MKKIFGYIFLLITISLACEHLVKSVYSIRIRNKSSQTIQVFAGYFFPDTLLPNDIPFMKKIEPSEFKDIYDNEVGDEEFKRFMNNERLTIFVISSDTLLKYSWNTIVDNYQILKRIEILPEDLEDYGSISYP